MLGKMLLISIKPKYAELIFNGKKSVELRRVCPKLNNGDLVLVYVSSPTKAIYGGFKVDAVISESPERLWNQIGIRSGLKKEEFDLYYKNAKIGYGITFSEVWSLPKPIMLESIKSTWPEFRPPQSYWYFKPGAKNIDTLYKMTLHQEILD